MASTTINPKSTSSVLVHQNKIDAHNLPNINHAIQLHSPRNSPEKAQAEESLPSHGLDLYSTTSPTSLESTSKNISSASVAMDYVFPRNGENGNGIGSSSSSSHESIANLLDEGLGTSLDGTEEAVTAVAVPPNSTLGRNDSGVFSGDEANTKLSDTNTTGSLGIQSTVTLNNDSPVSAVKNDDNATNPTVQLSDSKGMCSASKKNRPRNSSPNRQGPQRCMVCGKTFSNASALTKHKLTHSDERKHACTMCGKAFKRQDHLNGHMLTHRNKKPFECSAKGCGKSYCDARSLRRHVESRHGNEAGMSIPTKPISEGSKFQSDTNHSKQLTKGAKKNKKLQNNTSVGGGKIKNISNQDDLINHKALDVISTCANFTGFEFKDEVVKNDMHLPEKILPAVSKCDMNARTSNVGSKYVMVKLKDEYFLGSAVDEDEIIRNNNNSILISPETMATILSCANNTNQVSTCNSLTKDIILNISKSSIPSTDGESQLHQLLTQRATVSSQGSSGINLIPSSSMGSTSLTSTPLLNISPGALHNDLGGTHVLDWSRHQTEISESSSNLLPQLTRPGGLDVTTSALESEIIGAVGRKSAEAQPFSSLLMNNNVKAKTTNDSNISTSTVIPPASSSSYSAPNLLKEQLELIHQIIQQAHEESIISNCSTSLVAKTPKAKKSLSKMVHSNNNGTSSAGSLSSKSKIESSSYSKEDLSSKSSTQVDGKLVECTICYRKFKNTPALNGHMRLHGGYFKGGTKETESKRKDSSNKESTNAPLQTASVSVRALIEEKIIQKRNTNACSNTTSSQGLDGTKPGSVIENRLKSTIPSGFLYETHLAETPNLMINSNSAMVDGSCNPKTTSLLNVSPNDISTFKTEKMENSADNLSVLPASAEAFQFIYSQDQDQSDYLLMEEEVFNKVSSICPDSFLNGLDDSFLTGESAEDDLVGAGWTWVPSSADSKLNSILKSCTESESAHYIISTNENIGKGVVSETFGAMPSLDSNSLFYTSPAPKSPSIHSQDSPSYIYPTPPASLESHNAIQSPLFSSNTPSNNINSSGNNASTGKTVHHYENYLKMQHNSNPTTVVNVMEFDQQPKPSETYCTSSLLNDNFSIDTTVPTSIGSSESITSKPKIVQCRKPSGSGCLPTGETNATFLTPSCSPNLTGIGPEESSSSKSTKELKLNEPLRMDCSMSFTEEIPLFLNPNSVTYSPVKSSTVPTKRKHVRNTFASNLRPSSSSSSNCSHFTPYPILSPVRSAPGLYWTFSTKLSHVDDTRREKPRINIGYNFQATNLPNPNSETSRKRKRTSYNTWEENNKKIEESLDCLWDPSIVKNRSKEEVEKYLEFACCSAVPGGGRNKEFALHLLNHTKGDISAAILLLIDPAPLLPPHLLDYNYPEIAKWSREEVNSFQEALLRHGKDFLQISNEMKTKSRKECVIFYQLWKKVCLSEYEQIRNVWKKRDANFTLELLKTVPPPEFSPNSLKNVVPLKKLARGQKNDNETITRLSEMDEYILGDHLHSTPLTHEEFPCKVCGKIFHKVKSRSAHMKSHRPPDSPNLSLEISANSVPICAKKSKTSHPSVYSECSQQPRDANIGVSHHQSIA